MRTLLLTGYTGFVGRQLLNSLLKYNNQVVCLGRREPLEDIPYHYCDFADPELNFLDIKGIDTVIHCAGRAHIMLESSKDPLAEYRKVNTYTTIELAKAAVKAGAKRFIFISTLKVNGEETAQGKAFKYNDEPAPSDPYSQSKFEAEQALWEISKETGLEVVIIRPPLVYGAGVKANFASLMNLVSKGFPLPFRCIKTNQRSLVSVTNLVDLVISCAEHPNAANQVFLVSDDKDISTAEMIRQMAIALGKTCRMLPIPLWCYHLAGKVFRKEGVINRLTGSLQVDIAHTKETLNWVPPQSQEDGFKEAAEAFLSDQRKQSK